MKQINVQSKVDFTKDGKNYHYGLFSSNGVGNQAYKFLPPRIFEIP